MALNDILNRTKPTFWEKLLSDPCPTLARELHAYRQRLLVPCRERGDGKVVSISDTHNTQPALPSGDILVHAGDLTEGGTVAEIQAQLDWLDAQPHAHKIVIAGNHDLTLDERRDTHFGLSAEERKCLRWGSLIYLEQSAVVLKLDGGRAIKVFGHPSTRKNGNSAFQHERHVDVFSGVVPEDVDILLTHSPPKNYMDVAGWGDENLCRELWRVKPKIHVFGHIHEGAGQEILLYDQFDRLYQDVCNRKAGLLSLLYMLVLVLRLLVIGDDGKSPRTMLVNAAVVRGRVNEKKEPVRTCRV